MIIMKRTPEQWRELLAAQRASGLSAAAFCREHNLPAKSFYYWQRKLVSSSGFIRVAMPERAPSSVVCSLRVGASELRFSDAVSPTWLASVLRALA
jgi:hypothetical protein